MSTINNTPINQPEPHNAHRMGGYQDVQDWEDSELGKGPGDPDVQAFYIGRNPAYVQYPKEPDTFPGKLYPPWELKDEADNLPESAEQAGWDDLHDGGD